MSRLDRYFINQPSTLQEFHALHGMHVLADKNEEEGDICVCYFTEGKVVSQRIRKSVLDKSEWGAFSDD